MIPAILLAFLAGCCASALYLRRKRVVIPTAYKMASYRLPTGRVVVVLGFDEPLAYCLDLESAVLIHGDLTDAISKQEVVT